MANATEPLVLDASALLRVLLPGGDSQAALRIAGAAELHVPHLLDLEIVSALRGLCRADELPVDRAADALTDLSDLALTRYPHELLLSRIWELRHNLSAYDAAYVALAEALGAPLLTADVRLADTGADHRAVLELVA